jgi:N-acetylglucosamine-6-phosphate deacetylase
MPSVDPAEATAVARGDSSASASAPPSLFDFQVNGFGGVDFQQDGLTPSQLLQAVAALARCGTGQIFVTLISDTIDRLCARLENLENLRCGEPALRRAIAGYHLEGPWLSPETGYCGAHNPGVMQAPSLAAFNRLQAAAAGHIRLITLAPECPRSAECIAAITAAGVHVALGHTNADERQIDEAIAAGARFCTHLGNAVPAYLPRHDNVIQRLLARDELTACLIPDGVHLPPFVLRNFFRAKPYTRVLFTTDAMAGAGAGPGRYRLGEYDIVVGTDGIARQPDGPGFAGSTLTPDEGVRRVARFLDLPLDEARRLWSDAPRRAFGLTA